jgi:hypothetical protein
LRATWTPGNMALYGASRADSPMERFVER